MKLQNEKIELIHSQHARFLCQLLLAKPSKQLHDFLTTHVPFEDQEIFKDLWGEIEFNIHDITTGEMDEVEAIELFSYHCSLKKPTKAQQKNSNYR